ncbi:hypothetical protein D3C78_1890060 [compost metagenome]
MILDSQRLGCCLRLGVVGVSVGFFFAQESVQVRPAGVGIELDGMGRQSRIFVTALGVVALTLDPQRLDCCLRLGVGGV